eukprot:PLAT3313.22.p1 GENE.PLAT3313.22~~PLAT3313.22.p1  ORF type:complete len:455 (+),score=258.94 PLAT3313.22:61-1425(+)
MVKAWQDDLLHTVDRDNPEDQLDDFLDRTGELIEIIEYQHDLRSSEKLGSVVEFLSSHSQLWVIITYALVLIINSILVGAGNTTDAVPASGGPAPSFSDNHPTEYGWVLLFGILHLLMTLVMVTNYWLGSAPVLYKLGAPKSEDAAMLRIGGWKSQLRLPDFMWQLWALFTEPWSLYYIIYLLFSVLGVAASPWFFTIHTMDIAVRSRLLTYVLKSVTQNIGQLGATMVLGFVVTYLYTVVSFTYYNGLYEFGDGGISCNTLWQCLYGHLDYGWRGPPAWTEDPSELTFTRALFDWTYNVILILILVAIITGIIIDTFGELRDDNAQISDKTKNECFICGLTRDALERRNIDFDDHQENDHNMWSYVMYKVYLAQKGATNHTGLEAHVWSLMVAGTIDFFPIKRALALVKYEKNKEDEGAALVERVDALEDRMTEKHEEVVRLVTQVLSAVKAM